MSLEYYTDLVNRHARLTDAEMRPMMATAAGRARLLIEVTRLALMHLARLQRAGTFPERLSATEIDDGLDKAMLMIFPRLEQWDPPIGPLNTFFYYRIATVLKRTIVAAHRATADGPVSLTTTREALDDSDTEHELIDEISYDAAPAGLGDPLAEILIDERVAFIQQLAAGLITPRLYCLYVYGKDYTAAQLARAYADRKRAQELLRDE